MTRHFFGIAVALLVCAPSLAGKPLKVFILAGQSNMQGHADQRTLEHLKLDPASQSMLKDIQATSGGHKQVCISYLSAGGEKSGQLSVGYGASESKLGPELTFGIYAQKQLDQPILIIKTAWGGKSIHTDFRPPSAGPYVFNENQIEQLKKQNKDLDAVKAERAKATGHYYRLMLEHVQHVLSDIKSVYPDYSSEDGYELSGFVWFQGWNDMVDRGVYPNRDKPGGYDDYSKVMAHFIRDIRKDLKSPELPFVIGVFGVNGSTSKYLSDQKRYAGIHQNFRDAMAAPAQLDEFKGNVVAVLTEEYWDHELTHLRSRDNKIKQTVKQMVKSGELKNSQQKQKVEELRAKELSEQEIKILETGVSNAEYHYLGSAKILGGIGKAFAEAVLSIRD